LESECGAGSVRNIEIKSLLIDANFIQRWVQKEARPISLRQLSAFGRKLTEQRLLTSANYVRTELPIRLAHRIRDMQKLPFGVIQNENMSYTYNLYFRTFETLRKVPEIKTMKQNDDFCKVLKQVLRDNLSIVPRTVMAILETQGKMDTKRTDEFLTLLMKTRISRRVIAEQHLSLTETFHSIEGAANDQVGEVLSNLNAKEAVDQCASAIRAFAKAAYGDTKLPEVTIQGHLDATFTYIPSHLEYILGELLRNSFQAVCENRQEDTTPPPIEVTICESVQNVIIRISDRGLGIPHDFLNKHLWSFGPGPRRDVRLDSLKKLKIVEDDTSTIAKPEHYDLSLNSFTTRPSNLRLGIGLPMSKLYAEYWAGSLEIHSLEGYGVDAFLQLSKLGNQNEQLSMWKILTLLW